MMNKTEIMESKCVVCGNYILNDEKYDTEDTVEEES